MEIFEYLPQLIVAYDDNDKFANLIHVKKADKNKEYFCPCCGGTVKPRALDSTKEQSHYYHITGKCTKESQLHFFCKNWLFEKGSKFYINENLLEVDFIEVEKNWSTPFGDYRPDVSVHTTSGEIIYFEMFFSNRKTGDDYFCKWDFLSNSVVEVNIKEYMIKTDVNIIPTFTYLYHDGVCNSKIYVKKDLYANTIAKIKRTLTRQKVLDYKARIEKLDWFWQKIQKNDSREEILQAVSCMEYDDMVSCYEIVKRKNCVYYLKNDVLNIINESVIKKVRESIDIPYDENVYFDVKQHHGRTYEVGIRLNIELEHITFNDFLYHIMDDWHFDKICGYPKIVFKKSIFSCDEISIPTKGIKKLKQLFNDTVKYKNKLIEYEKDLCLLEGDNYKIRINNGYHTVLKKNKNTGYDLILDKYYIDSLNISRLENIIDDKITEIIENKFLSSVKESEHYQKLLKGLKNYNGIESDIEIGYGYRASMEEIGLYVSLWIYGHEMATRKICPKEDDLVMAINEYKEKIISFMDQYQLVYDVIDKINNCKNRLWKAEFYIDNNNNKFLRIIIQVDCWLSNLDSYIRLSNINIYDNEQIIQNVTNAMNRLLRDVEKCEYRVMWIDGGEE